MPALAWQMAKSPAPRTTRQEACPWRKRRMDSNSRVEIRGRRPKPPNETNRLTPRSFLRRRLVVHHAERLQFAEIDVRSELEIADQMTAAVPAKVARSLIHHCHQFLVEPISARIDTGNRPPQTLVVVVQRVLKIVGGHGHVVTLRLEVVEQITISRPGARKE